MRADNIFGLEGYFKNAMGGDSEALAQIRAAIGIEEELDYVDD